jgi:predicted tellurium resistance membrane protein TerC
LLDIIFSLLTLIVLEAILGIDNLVFISILSGRLPENQQKKARRIGLMLAWMTRLILLAGVFWIIGLTKPITRIFGLALSWHDFFLIAGGLFLLVKGTREIHTEMEIAGKTHTQPKFANFYAVISQIAIFDIVFSLDSILTAIGLTKVYWIMAVAITIAILIMLLASEPLTRFVNRHPTIKMLALSFLLLIGMVLIADGLHFEIPRGYLYFAVCFSLFVEVLNNIMAKRKGRQKPPKV